MRGRSRTRRTLLAAVAGAVALTLAACTSSSGGPGIPSQHEASFSHDVSAAMSTALEEAIRLADASAGFAGVWAPWAGSWTAAEGTTTRGGSKPVTEDMTFRIGQNTIPMTCTVLLRLVDQGKVGLDDQLTKWLPGMVGVEDVTLRELCANTSGIGDYQGQLGAEFLTNPTRQWPPLELASDGVAAPRYGKPGQAYGSSQTNAILLGMALQNATGSSAAELYDSELFGPLGLKSTVLPDAATLSVPGPHPAGYVSGPGPNGAPACDAVRDVSKLSPSMGWTAGGVVSDLTDLKTFAQALAAGSLLSEKSAAAQRDGVTNGASWQKYGLGVQQLGPLHGSSGAIPGYTSAMFADPSSGLTVVVALNNSTPGAAFARALAQRLASIASKVPAETKGAKVVESLPWSEQQMTDEMKKAAPCPAKEEPAKK
jgi:D-alanyl-D-alanine carboxypeptidase